MRDHAAELLALMNGRSRDDLDRDRVLALAVVRLLEIIGEAAARVPVAERTRRPDVPWSAIVGLRNRLIHGYDDVDHDIVWAIVSTDLPKLVSQLGE
ncbi:MAG: HepT-like ribonuclease domain-containing protein [Vicinamibacterales bacterium]